MQNYKIEVSKDNKKFNIILKAESEAQARDRVHKEGYSILTLKQIGDKEDIGNTFIFEGYKNGQFQHGKIVGTDIFKSYVKLKRDLGYEIDYIYFEKEENLPLEEKQKIIKELKEEYDLYYSGKKNTEPVFVKKEEKVELGREKIDSSAFFLNKQLEETNKLINSVLMKLNNVFAGKELKDIDSAKKEKLKQAYNEIIKLQKSSNISKLKEIGELALQKIGKLELEELEKTKSLQSRELLKETNQLLKGLGAKERFVEKDKDIFYQLNSVLNNIKNVFKSSPEIKKSEIDKESYTYIKNLLFLNKYREKLRDNTKFILQNFFKVLFNKQLREKTILERRVIKQNIVLFKARQKGYVVSYTSVKKGFVKVIENILSCFNIMAYCSFVVVFFYSLIFLVYFNIPTISFEYNLEGIYVFLIIALLYLIISISKNLPIIILNFVFLGFIIIFGNVNF